MGRIRTTKEIQQQYAEKKGYSSFTEMIFKIDRGDIDWHISNIQKEYALECVKNENTNVIIKSVIRSTDKEVFNIGDKIKFSDRYPNFKLEKIIYNTEERRVELYGDGIFCSLTESDCFVYSKK